ncbi:MAG: hypothetical protein MJH11_16910 [Lentisphaeria bacterium]|nr:hypothetical protein [Lentisphaeria bacterium]
MNQIQFDEMEMLDIDYQYSTYSPGLKNWGKSEYDPSIQKAVRIHPTDTLDGFFIAKLQKRF